MIHLPVFFRPSYLHNENKDPCYQNFPNQYITGLDFVKIQAFFLSILVSSRRNCINRPGYLESPLCIPPVGQGVEYRGFRSRNELDRRWDFGMSHCRSGRSVSTQSAVTGNPPSLNPPSVICEAAPSIGDRLCLKV